eukprot:5783362-Pyramimonas_sp.AAC.1
MPSGSVTTSPAGVWIARIDWHRPGASLEMRHQLRLRRTAACRASKPGRRVLCRLGWMPLAA